MNRTANTESLPKFSRDPLPKRFCNFERLMEAMEARGLDGLVAFTRYNVFYLTGCNSLANQADEMPLVGVIISRREPEHPIIVAGDVHLNYFLAQPTWVEDIRPFRGSFIPMDIPTKSSDIDRFIPDAEHQRDWISHARGAYAENRSQAVKTALKDLGLNKGRIGLDDMRATRDLAGADVEIVDAYELMMYVRQAKTADEVRLLRDATELNQIAIERTAQSWGRGMTWKELTHVYHKEAVDLGGFVHDPSAIVMANPIAAMGPIAALASGFEDFVVEPGMSIMFDCHGTLNKYCWDGGKSWVVDDKPKGLALDLANATTAAMSEIQAAMRPGMKVSELQAKGRRVFQRIGVPNPESVFIFFHGLGLSHNDVEASDNRDWAMEKDMVIASHVMYPGDERHRQWLEDISLVTETGGESFFTWGFDPL